MFVSSEVDDQKEEEKDAKTKTPFIIYSVCDVLHFRLRNKHLLLSPVSQRMFVTAISTADCENKKA